MYKSKLTSPKEVIIRKSSFQNNKNRACNHKIVSNVEKDSDF
jgi:hypothetical protein